jgi:hypothetical protein
MTYFYSPILQNNSKVKAFRLSSRLYNSIDSKIAAKKTIVIASTSFLIAVGTIAQTVLNRRYMYVYQIKIKLKGWSATKVILRIDFLLLMNQVLKVC